MPNFPQQRMLEEQIPQKEQRLAQLQAREANVDAFIEKAKQYTTIDTLTPELLRVLCFLASQHRQYAVFSSWSGMGLACGFNV